MHFSRPHSDTLKVKAEAMFVVYTQRKPLYRFDKNTDQFHRKVMSIVNFISVNRGSLIMSKSPTLFQPWF
jgi:hypothetical protein